MEISDLKLVRTSICCPEQYDVRYNDENVGYIRYRWGYLQVHPFENGEYNFNKTLLGIHIGNMLDGCLHDNIRKNILNECLYIISEYYNNK